MAPRTKWTEEEITLVCYVYLHTDVFTIEDKKFLSSIIGKTPKAINAKKDNIKRFDIEAIQSGESYLSNGAENDRIVWDRFQEDPEGMDSYALSLFKSFRKDEGEILDRYGSTGTIHIEMPPGADRHTIAKERLNQGMFRRAVLRCSEYKCCITGIKDTDILIASHIKPWRDCEPFEKTDVHNAFCFNSLHDRLFDKCLMTVDTEMRIHYSPSLRKNMNPDVYESMIAKFDEVRVNDKNMPSENYIRHHNSMFLSKNKRYILHL